MNAQVYHIEGQERKIKKSNNMIMQPHHSMYHYLLHTIVVCYNAQSKWKKGNKKRREGGPTWVACDKLPY